MNFDLASLKEVGGIFKFGKGVLGKSAIALGVLLLAPLIAVWRLHSDLAIIAALLIAALIFFIWFFSVIKFVAAHPDVGLLEGAEWSGYKRFEAAAKGYIPPVAEQQPVLAPGTQIASTDSEIQKQESEES